MASVFLSYDREDADKARAIATALEKAGHEVWWDLHVRGGAQFATVIEEALKAAHAVVVLWSVRSVESAWVRDEAAAGRDSGRLIPVALDGAGSPIGFRQFQTIDLSGRKGRRWSQHFDELLNAIRDLAPADTPIENRERAATTKDRKRLSAKWIGISVVAFLLIVGVAFGLWRLIDRKPSVPVIAGVAFGLWSLIDRKPSVPVVAVVAVADSADAAAVARDLLVKLGSLRAARTDALRLTGAVDYKAQSPDFIFEAAGSIDAKDLRANLALLTGKDRSVLWSKDFEAADGGRTALEQSMAYTAGQILDCALQASNPAQSRLDEQTLKLFLNGCALFGERYRSDPASVVPIFSKVVAATPGFQPAWSKLLLAEAQVTRGQILFYGRWAPGSLPEHIHAVRKLNPKLPELYVGEAALLPLGALEQRLRLLGEAVRLNPDNPDLLVVHSDELGAIGRMHDSLVESRRAAELDPLSPGMRSNLIQSLTYDGQLQAAEEELRRAQQLWPANPTIDDARFRLHSRYGDARDALRLVRSEEFRQPYPTQDMEPYLLARLDPTRANIENAIAVIRGAQLAEGRKRQQLAQLLAEFGRNDELYKELARLPSEQLHSVSSLWYRPPFRQFRRDSRFMPLAVRAGHVNIWRKTGQWPDFCSEPDLPYNCEAEATKLAT